jgi:hypothetical protein
MLLLVKALLTLVAAVGAWHALTPPQPPPRSQERVKSGGVERSFGSVVRIHALVWKVCYTAPCAPTRYTNHLMMYISTVFCHRKPHRRARCLSICHIVVVFVVAPLLLPHTKDTTTTVPTRLNRNRDTTPSFRARMSGNGRKRRVAPRMLQNARLPLHVRAHAAFRPPTGDRRAVRVCAASELQRRRARRLGHVARTLWSGLVVGRSGLAGHASGAGICHLLVCDGSVRAVEHHGARADGGCTFEEAVWCRMGRVGG